jgi:hypothetical protein
VLRIVANVLTPATSSTVDQAICLMAPFCSFGKSAVRITAAVMAVKPMFRSNTSATRATATKATRVMTWSVSIFRLLLTTGGAVATPPPDAGGDGSMSSSSVSIRRPISPRPPRARNSTTAMARLKTRLARKMASSFTGRPFSRITELVITP